MEDCTAPMAQRQASFFSTTGIQAIIVLYHLFDIYDPLQTPDTAHLLLQHRLPSQYTRTESPVPAISRETSSGIYCCQELRESGYQEIYHI